MVQEPPISARLCRGLCEAGQLMRYRFDQFEIDLERYELRRGRDVCPTEPLVFDLISYLVRNANRIVSRDDVVVAVWQGRAISDATISSCIKSARKALGDTGDNQSYIRTIRGRGFEFCANVEVPQDPASPEVPSPAAQAALSSPSAAAPLASDQDPKPILVVLPFSNLNAEADEYFADGLTEDIITNLSRFRDLRVIGGASSFQFKGRAHDLAEICARTNAGYVVQGSVRRAAGRLRISVQLIDGETGVQLWGDRYDREMVDIFDLQDEVTRVIAATLGVTMQDVALQRAMKKGRLELSAYDCLLRARRYTWMLSAEMHAEARDLLEKAVELDPLRRMPMHCSPMSTWASTAST